MRQTRPRMAGGGAALLAALVAAALLLGHAPAGASEPGGRIAGHPRMRLAPAPAAPAPAREDGCFVRPSVYCQSGDHRLDLKVVSRLRIEFWEAFTDSHDTFYGLRTRVGGAYGYADLLKVYAEFQDVRIWSLSPSTSGAGSLYRAFAGPDSRTDGQHLRQAWAEIEPIENLGIRGGRMDIHDGTEVMYPEANWRFLKSARTGQRLVGGVGWTHGERTNDAASLAYDFGDHHLLGFGGKPTTGVFDISDGYETQKDITYGGVHFTSKRGVWLPHTEVRLFYIGYDDDRPIAHGGLPGGVTVHTLGFSSIGVHPIGAGNLDLLVWFAGQWGDFARLDHAAAAGIFEAGYQLTEAPWKPWVRTGVNIASGDGNASDGDHNTFFNLLPTNHLYYGYADQFAFQNLINFFMQLKLQPHEKLGLDVVYHKFWLQSRSDGRYAGSGAFNRAVFGYAPAIAPPAGTRNAADEIDLVVNWNVHENLALEVGYARMWGHGVFKALSDRNVSFGYIQLTAKY
jgi:hypothetical protein